MTHPMPLQPSEQRPGLLASIRPRTSALPGVGKELTMFGVMVLLAIATAILNPIFLTPDNLRNTLRHVSLISLFALGEAVLIISGGIDLSIGSVICLTAVVTSYLSMLMGF